MVHGFNPGKHVKKLYSYNFNGVPAELIILYIDGSIVATCMVREHQAYMLRMTAIFRITDRPTSFQHD
jgi:hypothetical protein